MKMAYIVDDDVIVRRSLALTLRGAGYDVHPFGSGRDFLDALGYLRAGCVLLDVRMPEIDGLAVLAELRGARPDLAVLMMTADGHVPMAVQAMRDGAADFIEKPFGDDVLLASLDRIYGDLPRRAQRASAHEEATARVAVLSPRERDVVSGLMAGLPNKLIAFSLGLGVRTIETHRANVIRKTGARGIGEIVQLGLEAGLTPLA